MQIELTPEEMVIIKRALEKSIYPSGYFSQVERARVQQLIDKFS